MRIGVHLVSGDRIRSHNLMNTSPITKRTAVPKLNFLTRNIFLRKMSFSNWYWNVGMGVSPNKMQLLLGSIIHQLMHVIIIHRHMHRIMSHWLMYIHCTWSLKDARESHSSANARDYYNLSTIGLIITWSINDVPMRVLYIDWCMGVSSIH